MNTIPTYMYKNPNSSFILSFQNLKTLIRETDGWVVIGGIFRDIVVRRLHDERYEITFKSRDLDIKPV